MVASGLALGVFAGLVVVRGTGEAATGGAAKPVAGAPGVSAGGSPPAAPPGAGSKESGSESGAGTPSGAAAPSGAGTPSEPGAQAGTQPAVETPSSAAGADPPASAVAPQSAVAVVSFAVHPRHAHIFVNGAELAGTSADIPLPGGSASVQVMVKARGHKTLSKTYTVTGDQKIDIDLHRDHHDQPSGPGGLLDIR